MMFRRTVAILLLLSLAALTTSGAWAAPVPPWDDPAEVSFGAGIKMLEQGASRADVLAQWDRSLRDNPHGPRRRQLLVYTAVLRKQVVEDQRHPIIDAPESATLTLPQRIVYNINRLPDVHGEQRSIPGICICIGWSEGVGMRYSNAIGTIGRPALSALIAHLNDARLTRSVDENWTVLRVQDVAIQCIEDITDIHFISDFSYLSLLSPRQQAKTASEVRVWWQENKNKSPVQGLIGRLSVGSVYERIDVLQEIKRMDPRAVSERGLLTRWKPLARDSDVPGLAMAFARYGDFTLRPRVRRLMHDPNVGPFDCTSYLLRYGNIADCRYIHHQAQADLAEKRGLGTSRMLGEIAESLSPLNMSPPLVRGDVRNPLAVPACADLLSFSRYDGQTVWEISVCLRTLAVLTGHEETRRRDQGETDWHPAAARWLTWWQDRGEADYLAHHPDVRRVLAP